MKRRAMLLLPAMAAALSRSSSTPAISGEGCYVKGGPKKGLVVLFWLLAAVAFALLVVALSSSSAQAAGKVVQAWGANSDGQLGDGTNTPSNLPVAVSNLSKVKAIAGGGAHSLALKKDGTVWAWGDNNFGQLGNGTTSTSTTNADSNVPVAVSNLSKVKAIAGGSNHSLAS